jgi:hypothetical protein
MGEIMTETGEVLAAWLLTGAGLGLMSTAYGAVRAEWRLWKVAGHFLDWLWFVLAAIFVLTVYIWTDWGVFHFWSLLVMSLGYGLWVALAAPVMFGVFSRLVFWQARLLFYFLAPGRIAARGLMKLWRMARGCGPRINPPPNPPQS